MEKSPSPTSRFFFEPKSNNVIDFVDFANFSLVNNEIQINSQSNRENLVPDPSQYIQSIFEKQEVEEEKESETDVKLWGANKCKFKIKFPLLKKKPAGGSKVKEAAGEEASTSDLRSPPQHDAALTSKSQKTKKTKKQKHRHTDGLVQAPSKSARLSKSQSDHEESDHKYDDEEPAVITCRPRGRLPKPHEPEVLTFAATVYVELAMHLILQKGKTKCGDKVVKQDPKTYGPFTLTYLYMIPHL
ncbi:hypothetical protein C0995_009134 [Termitomyces sp. Mi166|nr:hypothetical protein C0995_009134 [Termitomyces sp. Mi166\